MREWRETNLGEVIEIKYGKDHKHLSSGKIPAYGSGGVMRYVDTALYDDESILIPRKGSLNNVIYESKPFWTVDTMFWSKINKKLVYPKFLFYQLTEIDYMNLNVGSAVPSLTVPVINAIEISLPSIEEQKAIASVLSILDDKIDLLHRQNITLECMAETLFRKWFVEEAQESWVQTTLGNVLISIESGSRPKGGIDPDLNFGIPSIGAENINGLGRYQHSKTKFITNEFFQVMKKGIIRDFDVLIYKDGAYVGRKAMFGNGYPFDLCCINEHVFILRGNKQVNQFFLYFLLQEEDLALLNTNSAQPGLNQESMKSFEITLPPIALVNAFGEMVKPIINKILENGKQIQTLEKLRDNLLPKLMSGEVRVN